MCKFCEQSETGASCEFCGRLVCFDVKNGDDILHPAAATSSGDLACVNCAREIESDEAEEFDDFYDECDMEDMDDPQRTGGVLPRE